MKALLIAIAAVMLAGCPGPEDVDPDAGVVPAKMHRISTNCVDVQIHDENGAPVNAIVCSEKYILDKGCTVINAEDGEKGFLTLHFGCLPENQPPKQ